VLNHRHTQHHRAAHHKTSSAHGSGGSTTPIAPLPANVSQPLHVIYQEFEAAGGQSSFPSIYRGVIEIDGSRVGVMIHGNGGDFNTLVSDMTKLGLQANAEDATTQTISGLLPIGALGQAANDPLTLSVTPIFLPQLQMR
jgi:hypothetical protein